jgi:hypothetical protein
MLASTTLVFYPVYLITRFRYRRKATIVTGNKDLSLLILQWNTNFVGRVSRHRFLLITNSMHFFLCIYLFHLSTCFEHQVLIIGRSNCINTSSGMISLSDCLICRSGGNSVPSWPAYQQSLTQTYHTRWCINIIRSPDDEHLLLETCREMKWTNKYMKKCIRLITNTN